MARVPDFASLDGGGAGDAKPASHKSAHRGATPPWLGVGWRGGWSAFRPSGDWGQRRHTKCGRPNFTTFDKFGLELHGEKTRLLEFGRHAAERRKQSGLGKPETFTFLGFTFISGKSRRGAFQLQRKSRRDRMRAKLREVKEQLRRRMQDAIPDQGRWLKAGTPRITQFLPTRARLSPSDITSLSYGCARCDGAAKRTI
jgi:hypothetical protein